MNAKRKTAVELIMQAFLLTLLLGVVLPILDMSQPAFAQQQQGGGGGGNGDDRDSNPTDARRNRQRYYLRMKNAKTFSPTEFGGHDKLVPVDQSSGLSRITNGVRNLVGGNVRGAAASFLGKDGKGPYKSDGPGQVKTQSGPTFMWPVPVPAGVMSEVPTFRDEGINDNELKTFGYPVSDTQFQLIQRYNDNIMLEQMFDPEKLMWMMTSTAGLQSTSAANSAANMAVNQSISAIDFTKKYLVNFTAEQGNVWHKIRDQLFIPMAILLLLPGAVLAQVKAIVSQGSPVWAQSDSPIEGITRSIVATFLIPGTFLVINYGIDVSNSITFTIADEYKRIFGTDMYEDAICHEKRAFPVNPQNRARNAIVESEKPKQGGSTVWSAWEAKNLNVREYDPCLGVDNTRVPDEDALQAKNMGRIGYNGANAGITAAWNVMCAFQMAYLYYLWCMGPIAAACWVWPVAPMRNALKSWIEGVIVLCFWSLFWNTVILLLAAFKGVGDNGAAIVTALNTLANLAVKKAFDFAGLVSEGGAAAAGEMKKAMGGGGGGGAGGGKGGPGGPGSPGTGATGTPGTTTTSGPGTGVTPTSSPDGTLALAGPTTGTGTTATGTEVATDPITGAPLLDANGQPIPTAGAFVPGLPPGEKPTGMGRIGGADAADEAAAMKALGIASGPPSADPADQRDKAAFDRLKAQDDKGNPAAAAAIEAIGKTQPGDLEKALGDPSKNIPPDADAAKRVKEATGMDAKVLGDALYGKGADQAAALMTCAAVVGAGGSAAAGAELVKRAEAGDAAARAQLEQRTGVSADAMLKAAAGNDQAQFAVLARAGLDDKVREAARRGDETAMAATSAADQAYARNATTGEYQQIAAYDPNANNGRGGWEAIVPGSITPQNPTGEIARDSSGNALLTYDQTTGTYRTQDGASVSYDAQSGQWLARDANGDTGGGIVYDMNDKRFEVAGTNTPVDYQNGNFVASGTNGNVVWDAQQNRFEDRATGQVAISDPGGSGQWFRTSADGQSIQRLDSSSGNWVAAGSGAPIEMQNGQIVAAGTNGNVVFDQAQGRFEARNVDAPLAYSPAKDGQGQGQWYAQGTAGQVAYDVGSAQFRATAYDAGSGMYKMTSDTVSYSNGQYSVDSTGGKVVYDAAQGRYEVAGTNTAVAYDQSAQTWVGQGTQGQVVFDRQDGRFETRDGQVAVSDPSGSGRWYTAAADGSVSVLSAAGQGAAMTWSKLSAESSPIQVSRDGAIVASNSGGNVYFDQKDGRWEYRAGDGRGGYTETNVAMARDAQSGNWVAANTGGQVVFDSATKQLEVYGTNTAVARDATTGQFVVAGTGGSVVLDNQSGQGARWEVKGTDTPVVQDVRSGQWVAADSRGAVVWDAQQGRFEQARFDQASGRIVSQDVPVIRDPGGQGWYSVASNGMVTSLTMDQQGQPQWRSVDPASAPIRVDAQGNITAAGSNGAIAYDQRENRWEVASTGQAIQYDSRTSQWVAPETGGKVAYDFTDRRLEAIGPNGQSTNIPVVMDPSGRNYYAVSATQDGVQMRQLDASSGTWRQPGADAGIAVVQGAGGQPQIVSTASIAAGDPSRTPQVVYDTAQGRWEVANSSNPAMNGTPVVQEGGKFYAEGMGRQIAYDVNDRRFEVSGNNTPVVQDARSGQWVAADSRGSVVWDPQQQRFEQARVDQATGRIVSTDVPVIRDPGGQGWYTVAQNGSVTALTTDAQGQAQWRQIDPQQAPIRVHAQGNLTAAGTAGAIAYDRRENRWEVAGTNQAVQYDRASNQWIAPESGGKVAYDVADRRFEMMGADGKPNNVPVVTDPSGRNFYAVSATQDGVQMRVLDPQTGTWTQPPADSGIAVMQPAQAGAQPQIYSTSSIAAGDATRTPQVVFDQREGRWEVANNPNPAYNGVPVVSDGGKFFAEGTGRQIAYDVNDRRFELVGTNSPVVFNPQAGGWCHSGTNEPVALRSPEGTFTTGTYVAHSPNTFAAPAAHSPHITPYSTHESFNQPSSYNQPTAYQHHTSPQQVRPDAPQVRHDPPQGRVSWNTSGVEVRGPGFQASADPTGHAHVSGSGFNINADASGHTHVTGPGYNVHADASGHTHVTGPGFNVETGPTHAQPGGDTQIFDSQGRPVGRREGVGDVWGNVKQNLPNIGAAAAGGLGAILNRKQPQQPAESLQKQIEGKKQPGQKKRKVVGYNSDGTPIYEGDKPKS